jgi:hypothetical protein
MLDVNEALSIAYFGRTSSFFTAFDCGRMLKRGGALIDIT